MSKLYVVGIGPGGYEQMTVKAVKVLEECDIIVGYTVYTACQALFMKSVVIIRGLK